MREGVRSGIFGGGALSWGRGGIVHSLAAKALQGAQMLAPLHTTHTRAHWLSLLPLWAWSSRALAGPALRQCAGLCRPSQAVMARAWAGPRRAAAPSERLAE